MMHFERTKKVIASGTVASLGLIGILGLSMPAEATSNPSAKIPTANKMTSIKGLVIGEKLNNVKIISPVKNRNMLAAILSPKSASSSSGEDLAVVYSPILSNSIKKYAGIKNKNEAIGFLFTDGGKKSGIVESIVYVNAANLVVRAISSANKISSNWQQLYPLSAGPKPASLGYDITDRSILLNNHRGVEILIENINTPAQSI